MVNDSFEKDTWKQLKINIQNTWGMLTDNELDLTKGDMHKISGLVRTRYGQSERKIRERLGSFLNAQPIESKKIIQ